MSSTNGSVQSLPQHVRVCIAGTGFSGIGMAIRLKQDGIQDFVVLERADDLGGTWRDNTYPGCACDVPSHLYSFSFAPNPGWPPHLLPAARDPGLPASGSPTPSGSRPHMRFGHELVEAAWDDERAALGRRDLQGTLTADVVVSAVGPLQRPGCRTSRASSSFPGAVFHSAHWDHDYDLDGQARRRDRHRRLRRSRSSPGSSPRWAS